VGIVQRDGTAALARGHEWLQGRLAGGAAVCERDRAPWRLASLNSRFAPTL